MNFNDLAAEQARDLDYKIGKAVDVIRQAYAVSKHRASIAFSGGKDSTVLWHLIRTHFPEEANKTIIIYGNTGVEYPECVRFARKMAKEWGAGQFYEATPTKTKTDGLKYAAQQQVLQHLIDTGKVKDVLKADGKLKSTSTLEKACPPEMWERFEKENLVWREGTKMNYWWCIDQYGWPLMGKAFSRLKARRINIDCFLRFSETKSDDPKMKAYYDLLRQAKISQACCDILKKTPSKIIQRDMKVDLVFMGMMASESRRRALNFLDKGYLYALTHDKVGDDPVHNCNPLSIWTDEDIWDYIHRFNVPYASLYDMGWTDTNGEHHKIKRNGCIGCGTDLLFPNNHMAMMRRTHPTLWEMFMRKGMAHQIQILQIARRNGQMSLFDVYDANQLLEIRPCIFDRVDKLVLEDDTADDAFDPELD